MPAGLPGLEMVVTKRPRMKGHGEKSMKINIVYATILGTSQMVAEELEDAFSDEYEINVQDILQVSPTKLSDDAFYVFISSSTGHGDLPDSAFDLVDAISKTQVNLSNINFAIFDLAIRICRYL